MRVSLFLLLSVLPFLGAVAGCSEDRRAEGRANVLPDSRPNIVLIISDDLGYPYHGFQGNEIVQTPNIDQLAVEGTTFTHAYSSASVCRPALQTILSGLHPRSWNAQRDRLEEVMGTRFRRRSEVEQYVTLPRHLARKGYRTFQGGKHWEGNFRLAGFDVGTTISRPFSLFSPDWFLFGRRSVAALDEFLDGVGEDEPFFLFFAPMLPHLPHDPVGGVLSSYQGLGLEEAAVGYYANITRFDKLVGRLIADLDARGLRDDTLFIYVSDNGWEQGPYDRPRFLSTGLGGDRGKYSIYELGFRSPLIFSWPGRIPENEQRKDLVTFEDLHATILQYAGAPLPPDHDGLALSQRIAGHGERERDHLIGFQDRLRVRESEFVPPMPTSEEDAGFLRTNRWRYVEFLDRGEQALYEIEEDPYERNDVSAWHPKLISKFAAATAAWRDALDEPAAWIDFIGRLTTEGDRPAPGLRLWLEGLTSSTRLEVFSDDRGFFRFPNVPADDYTLTYEIEAPIRASASKPPTSTPITLSREIDLNRFETGPFLSIRIPGSPPAVQSGPPASSTIEIEVFSDSFVASRALPVQITGWTGRGYVEQRVLSGPDGVVLIDQLPSGLYRIEILDAAGNRTANGTVYLGQGESEAIAFDLS
jgi:uncharacterized sulfatase